MYLYIKIKFAHNAITASWFEPETIFLRKIVTERRLKGVWIYFQSFQQLYRAVCAITPQALHGSQVLLGLNI